MDLNILDFHLDILILIFKQIETFEDQKNFARSHPKLWHVFTYQKRKDVRSVIDFDEREEFVINSMDFIFEWWGANVTTIYNIYNYVDLGDLLELAVKFCPNLDCLSIDIKKKNLQRVEENLRYLKQLKELNMRIDRWDFLKKMDESEFTIVKVISSMQSLSNLRRLNFGSYSLTKNERKQLNELLHLEELKIGPIEVHEVDDLSNLLGHIRVLIIEYYPDTQTLNRLAMHCTNVERLSLEDYNNRSFHEKFFLHWRIAYFPKLTDLHIFKGSCRNPFLCNLDSRYNDQLQILNIPCLVIGELEIARIADLRVLKELFCMYIKPCSISTLIRMQLEHIHFWESKSLNKFDLIRLIKESSTLKNLRCACHDIDIEFLAELLDVLEAKGFHSDQPFQLNNTTYTQAKRNKELMMQFSTMPKAHLIDLSLN